MYLWKVNEPSVGMTSTIWHLLQLKRPWLVTIFESVNPKLWWWECETVTVPKFLISFMDRFYVIQIQLICSTLWKCGGSNSFPVNSRQLFLTVPRQQTIFKLIGIPQGKLRRHRKTSTSAPTNRVLCPTFNRRRGVDFGLKSYMHVRRRWYVSWAKRHYHTMKCDWIWIFLFRLASVWSERKLLSCRDFRFDCFSENFTAQTPIYSQAGNYTPAKSEWYKYFQERNRQMCWKKSISSMKIFF